MDKTHDVGNSAFIRSAAFGGYDVAQAGAVVFNG
jgi:hypothetical protein